MPLRRATSAGWRCLQRGVPSAAGFMGTNWANKPPSAQEGGTQISATTSAANDLISPRMECSGEFGVKVDPKLTEVV